MSNLVCPECKQALKDVAEDKVFFCSKCGAKLIYSNSRITLLKGSSGDAAGSVRSTDVVNTTVVTQVTGVGGVNIHVGDLKVDGDFFLGSIEDVVMDVSGQRVTIRNRRVHEVGGTSYDGRVDVHIEIYHELKRQGKVD